MKSRNAILIFFLLTSFLILERDFFVYKDPILSSDADIQVSNVEIQLIRIDDEKPKKDLNVLRQEIIEAFGTEKPQEWGEKVSGVKTRMDTTKKTIALTFDADPGGYDAKLIDHLIKNNIPATLFVTGKWIEEYPDLFKTLAANPLFEIENHGALHRPCSADGKSAYGIKGTVNVGEITDEIEMNAITIEKITGRKPKYYRAATAYQDEICVNVARKLGYDVINYNVLGDAGATFSAAKVTAALLKAEPGSITIFHMNHPESGTADGIISAIPQLKQNGFEFVILSEYGLK